MYLFLHCTMSTSFHQSSGDRFEVYPLLIMSLVTCLKGSLFFLHVTQEAYYSRCTVHIQLKQISHLTLVKSWNVKGNPSLKGLETYCSQTVDQFPIDLGFKSHVIKYLTKASSALLDNLQNFVAFAFFLLGPSMLSSSEHNNHSILPGM